MNSQNIYKLYLSSYLKLIKEQQIYNTEKFFISFCDIDSEIFESLNYDKKIFEYDVEVLFLNNDEYYDAVNIRNDINRNNMIILTNKSIKNIDSLKHFSEFSIIPPINDNSLCFFNIITDLFKFTYTSIQQKKYNKFFNTILQYKKPTIAQLLKYIDNSIYNEKLNDKKLNKNLYLLNCWSSNKEELLTITDLKKIIHNSDIIEITNRLENVKDKLIRKNVYNGKFEKLLKNGYEKVETYFKNNSRKKDLEKKREETQWIFSYDSLLEEYEYKYDISEYEKEKFDQTFNIQKEENDYIQNNDDNYQHLIDLIKYYNSFRNIFQSIEYSNTYIVNLCDKIKLQCKNINHNQKEELENLLNEFTYEYNNFLSYLNTSKRNMKYPFLLFEFTHIAKNFAKAYFNILQFIYSNQQVLKVFNAFGLIEEIQNIFLVNTGNSFLMPFYHPVFITYLCKLEKCYTVLYEKLSNNVDGIEANLLLEAMNVLKKEFPIRNIYWNKKLFQLETKLSNNPFFVQFSLANHNSSVKNVDTSLVFYQIYQYIEKNPYISQLKVLIIGDLDLDNVRIFENRIKTYVEDDQNLFENIILSLAPGDKELMRKQLDEYFSNEVITDKIKFKFSSKVENLKDDFIDAVNGYHLVIFLDTQILYLSPYLEEVKTEQNFLTNKVIRNSFDNFTDELVNRKNTLNYLWEGLQNAIVNQTAKLMTWNSTEIDSYILDKITSVVGDKLGFEVAVLSSNINIKDSIYIKNRPNFSSYDNRGSELVCINFSSKQNLVKISKTNFIPECTIPLQNFIISMDKDTLEAFLPTELEEIYINFLLIGDKIEIKGLIPEKYKEVTNSEDCLEMIKSFLNYIYCDNHDIFRDTLKEICAFQSYSYCRSYSDVFLCHYIHNYFSYYNCDINIQFANISDINNFDYFKAKKFVYELISRPIFSEGSIKDFNKNYYENNFLEIVYENAKVISPLYDLYQQQMEKLIQGVNEYDK